MRGPTKAFTGKILVVQIQLQVVVAYKRWSHMEVFRTVLNLYTGNLTAGEDFWFSFPFVSCESSKGLCSWKRKIFSGQPYVVALPSSAQFKLNCNIIMLCFNIILRIISKGQYNIIMKRCFQYCSNYIVIPQHSLKQHSLQQLQTGLTCLYHQPSSIKQNKYI